MCVCLCVCHVYWSVKSAAVSDKLKTTKRYNTLGFISETNIPVLFLSFFFYQEIGWRHAVFIRLIQSENASRNTHIPNTRARACEWEKVAIRLIPFINIISHAAGSGSRRQTADQTRRQQVASVNARASVILSPILLCCCFYLTFVSFQRRWNRKKLINSTVDFLLSDVGLPTFP